MAYTGSQEPVGLAAARLERLAVRLNIFWINHRGSYTGAREPGLGILNAAGNNYCIEAGVATITLFKAGPLRADYVLQTSRLGLLHPLVIVCIADPKADTAMIRQARSK